MSTARDRILAKLRGTQPATPNPLPNLDAHFAPRARGESVTQRAARFKAGIEAFHAEVHLATEAGWPALLARLCADKGVTTLLYGADTPSGPQLAAAPFVGTALRAWSGPVEGFKAELFHRIDAGFTQGIELEAKGRAAELFPSLVDKANPLSLRASLNLYRSKVDALPGPDNRLEGQPPWTANIGIDWPLRGVPLTDRERRPARQPRTFPAAARPGRERGLPDHPLPPARGRGEAGSGCALEQCHRTAADPRSLHGAQPREPHAGGAGAGRWHRLSRGGGRSGRWSLWRAHHARARAPPRRAAPARRARCVRPSRCLERPWLSAAGSSPGTAGPVPTWGARRGPPWCHPR